MQMSAVRRETPDEEWTCVACRINIYWASQHYEDLAGIDGEHGLPASASDAAVPGRSARQAAMSERAERGGRVEHKVRQIARRAMRRQN